MRAAPPVAAHATQRAPAVCPAARSVTIVVTVTAPPAAARPAAAESADIARSGPDGQGRRFAVEGGREELPSRVILKPGQSAAIQVRARK
jgi:hypothetical protein